MKIKERIQKWLGIDEIHTKISCIDRELDWCVEGKIRNAIHNQMVEATDSLRGKMHELSDVLSRSNTKQIEEKYASAVIDMRRTLDMARQILDEIQSESTIDSIVDRIKRKQLN